MKTWDRPFKAVLIHRATKLKGEFDKWAVVIDGFETFYSKGIGLREGFQVPHGRISLWDEEQFLDKRKSQTVDPTAAEVLAALASDAQCYLDSRDIDEFARDLGYQDGPVSKTIEAFEGCRKAAHFFQSRGLDPADWREE